MVLLTILFLLILQFFAWIKYKDILCPAVMHNILWIISIIGLFSIHNFSDLSLITGFTIISGSILFQFGFGLSYRDNPIIYAVSPHGNMMLKKTEMRFSIFIVLILFAIAMRLYLRNGLLSAETFYVFFSETKKEIDIPEFVTYLIKGIQYFAIAILIIYWEINNKRLKKEVYLLLGIAVFANLTVPTRNSMLQFFLPLMVAYFLTHRTSNKVIIRWFIIGVAVFLAYFFYISLGKYYYIYESSDSYWRVFLNELLGYLSPSIYAFDMTWADHAFTRMGENTFRFFYALFDSMTGAHTAHELVQDFWTDGQISTNVYTFYDYYVCDFGIPYALLIMFFLSIIYGYLYSKVQRGKLWHKFMIAELSYPLVMQFFQDQYFSLFSTWLQILIVSWIVYKTDIFISKRISRQ